MSLTSRARAIQLGSNLTHQQAVELIRGQGERAARLTAELGWSLKEADAHLLGLTLQQRAPDETRELCDCSCCGCKFLAYVRTPGPRREECPWCDEHGQYPPVLTPHGGGWEARSTMYPDVVAQAPTRAAAVQHVRSLEVAAFGADYEDYGNWWDD